MITETALTERELISGSPEETFELGESIGRALEGGEVILLVGSLGSGKTLLTKGIMSALDYDTDEVTSPSFTLVNRYAARLDVYHIDLWRLDGKSDAAFAVGLEELLEEERAVIIIEWAERLGERPFPPKTFRIELKGDGDLPRRIRIREVV